MWALLLVYCLPKERLSRERNEEQRGGRTCAAAGKFLLLSASGDHRQGLNIMQKRKSCCGALRFPSELRH